jgi:hypothetical protein
MLHYQYFYAFNDWRKAAEGINNHEGDWEAATVFLKGENPEPYGVALSQHHDGVFLKWQDMHKVKEEDGKDTYHPLIYVALGSHANYPRPCVVRAPELFKKGFVQTIIYGLDLFIRRFTNKGLATEIADGRGMRLQVMPQSEAVAKAMDTAVLYQKAHEEELLDQLKDTDLSILSTRMQSIVRGEEPELHKSQQVIRKRIPSEVQAKLEEELALIEKRLEDSYMKLILLDPLPKWVEYRGLWGVKSWLKDESGPPGPMWDRAEPGGQFPRLRWQWPVEWLTKLES